MAVRVAFCITELDPGGAERALFEIVTRLDPAQWEVRVYCLGPETALSRQLQERGIATVCFGVRRWYQVGVLFRLTQQLREFRPAVLQTFLFHANILGRLAGWWAGVPVILSGLRVAERGKRWHLWLDRWTNRLVRLNVCVSEGVRQFAISPGGLKEQKLRVIPNGVDAERFASAEPVDLSRFGIPTEAWTLVTVVGSYGWLAGWWPRGSPRRRCTAGGDWCCARLALRSGAARGFMAAFQCGSRPILSWATMS